jgi:hypothetical protein
VIRRPIFDALEKVCKKPVFNLESFNDRPKTTKRDVVAVFKQAIKDLTDAG